MQMFKVRTLSISFTCQSMPHQIAPYALIDTRLQHTVLERMSEGIKGMGRGFAKAGHREIVIHGF
jgi:hypothetical protein